MPSQQERQEFAAQAVSLAVEIGGDLLPPLVRENLDRHICALIVNVETFVSVSSGATRFANIAPGFGLLVLKSRDWKAEPVVELPEPVSAEAVRVLEGVIAALGDVVLPDPDEPVYQHHETADGLICAFYRMAHEATILEAAGVDLGSLTDGVTATVVH